MTTLTLSELKAENAKAEADKEAEEVQEQEVLETDLPTEEVEEEAAEVESEPEEDEGEEDAEVESWMQSEEADSQEDRKAGFVPNKEAAKRRLQAKALKAEVADKDKELEDLRRQLNEAKQGAISEPERLPPRPKREDFDYDDDKYDLALDDWYDKRAEVKARETLQKETQTQQQTQQQQKAVEAVNNAVSDHYNRAQKLVDSGKITEDAYRKADQNVRQSMATIYGESADVVTDSIISTLNSLGEGSEKVMYMLGVNGEKLARFQQLLMQDQSGLQASAYLGSLQSSVNTPVKKRSNAPRPGAKVDGDSNGTGKAGTLYKQWSKLEPGTQERISLKRKAKQQGIDTSKW